jgi:uncharacterized protein (DUF2141 family)
MKSAIALLLLINSIALAQPDAIMREAKNVEATGTYSITVTITNIRNNKGAILMKFYDDSAPFPDKDGFLRVVLNKSDINGDTYTQTFHGFPSKNMAIALLDDENDNQKLDMGWVLPKEGHAFSDYVHSVLRKPVYEDFDFLLTGDRHVTMRMKYY